MGELKFIAWFGELGKGGNLAEMTCVVNLEFEYELGGRA